MSKTIILQAPVVLKIQADDEILSDFARTATFALASARKNFVDKGVEVHIDGEHAIVSHMDEGKLASFTMKGIKLDDRHFRVRPDDENGFGLEISADGGLTFDKVGSFVEAGVADRFGRAWAAGRTESDQ
jgi:hypothetical protein